MAESFVRKRAQGDQANAKPSQPARHPSPLVALHATIGNRAVESLVRDGPGALAANVVLQRDAAGAIASLPEPHLSKARKSRGFTEEDRLALARIQDELDKVGYSDWSNPDVSGLPPVDANMLWDLWKARTGEHFVDGKMTGSDSSLRLADLSRFRARLSPLMHRYHAASPTKARQYRAHIDPLLDAIQTWAYSAQASERAGDTDAEAVDLDPEVAAKKAQLLELAQNAGKLIGSLGEMTSTMDQAVLQKEFQRFKKPEFEESEFHTNVEHFNHVLSAVNLILTIADAKKRAKQFEELEKQLGQGKEHSGYGAAATATEIYTTCLKLVSQATTFGARAVGIVAKLRGLKDEAEACFKFAEEVGSKIGTIVSALEVAHGVLVLCDAKSKGLDKADAVVDIYAGGMGLAGSFGVISMSTVAEFTIPVTVTWAEVKWLGAQGADFIAAAYQIDLNQAYRGMREDGNEVAKRLVRTRKLYELAHEKHTAAEQRGYDAAVHESLNPLQEAIYDAAVRWSTSKQRAFASRYGEPGLHEIVNAAMDAKASPELVMAAGAILLKAMMKCNKDYPAVLKDTYREHGMTVPEDEAGKE